MKTYETLSIAVEALKSEGYTHDFKLEKNGLHCETLHLKVDVRDFEVDEVHRFEGMTNPADSSVIYAISSSDGTKGMIIDAYGVYSDSLSFEMLQKLRRKP